MSARFLPRSARKYAPHPRFRGVRIALLISAEEEHPVGVTVLEIEPGVSVPVHTHDPQIDSIYVLAGAGEALVNGSWVSISAGDYLLVPAGVEHGVRANGPDNLELFVHHSPPLL